MNFSWDFFWKIVEKILDFGSGVNSIVEKSLPDAEMQKEIYTDNKKVADGKRMQRILRQAKRYLVLNPKERKDIDAYVEWKHDALDEDDRKELKRLLHLRFDKKKK